MRYLRSIQSTRQFSTYRATQASYGFIGLGAMGLNMANNLAKKKNPQDKLVVFDLNTEATKKVIGPNVEVAQSTAEVAQKSDTIITMLPEGKHVKGVFEEITKSLKDSSQKLFIDSSTIDVQTSIATSKLIKDKNLGTFIDAPVSGGTVGALNGTLTFMVGVEDTKEVENVLKMMGGKLFACGKPGSGLAAKLANNYILALNNIAAAEGFQLANKLGLNMNKFSEIVNTSSGRSWSSEVNNPVPDIIPTTPSSRDYENGFGISLMLKDLKLAIGASDLVKLNLLLGVDAANVYEKMVQEGLSKKDMSVIYKYLEK